MDNTTTEQGWVSADLKDTSKWIHHLKKDELAALDRALGAAKEAKLGFDTLTKENFPLNELRATFDYLLEEIEKGFGFFVLRGLPAKQYSKDELRLIYWGIGLHLGTAISQSSRGDVLSDVRNFGVNTFSKKGRGYMSSQHLEFHADSADVTCLMVLRVAKSGGLSRYCSSIAIHDEIAKTRPDLLKVLHEPFYFSWKNQEPPGALPHYEQPLFTREQGKFASRFMPQHIIGHSIQRPELPPLTAQQKEAIELVEKLANDPHFYGEMMFEPGDMQFMNNHIMYHSRTEFEDYEEPDQKRHLIRLWLSVPNSRPLNESMRFVYRDVRPGTVRGGFPCFTGARVFETPAITD